MRLSSSPPADPSPPPFTDGWDEGRTVAGAPRGAAYAALLGALERVDLRAMRADVEQRVAAAGVTFGADAFAICPVPRLLDGDEWALLSGGLSQRVRALSAFVADAYGERAIVAAGVVPERVIEQAEGYEPELRGRWPGAGGGAGAGAGAGAAAAAAAPIGVAGLDVVRDRDGELLVLEDNLRTPSGFSYAVAARAAVTAALADALPAGAELPQPRELEPAVVAALRATLHDAAAAVLEAEGADAHPCVVVLGEGSGAGASYEHAVAARWLDAPLVSVDELERRGDELWLPAAARRVHAVYRRTDSDRLRGDDGRLTPAAQLLLDPWLAGRVGVVNAFGTGVADDKLSHAYVEAMIGFYLGEQPLLRSVPTLDLDDPAARERVLADLRAHVVKPRHGHGGHGVVVCAHASDADVARIAAQLRRPDAGDEWVAQATVALSSHPTIVGDALQPRHVDLRPYVFATRTAATVVPGGLTRVAWDAGALVVNSSQDGGAKDTWVLR